ncbi:hypothetical protein [Natrinema caseinilyticum]|uniref:hypothetical protein n=1 Tax=Natrinema caseinilyticum TaxID=2961570 RepID=UPI0020C54E39|nr:hypothetical protein [Natrinema caseinilyticum]
MGRSDSESGPSRRSGPLLVLGFVVVLVAGSLLVARVSASATVTPAVGAVAVLIGLAGTITSLRRRPTPTDTGNGGDADSSVWNSIPSEQYDGRHAESGGLTRGGLTRGEQERALDDVRQRAADLSDDPFRR